MIPYDVSIKYMIGGYAAIFLLLAGYLVSLIRRWRKARRDLKMLEEMQKK
jgi:CcmD family protein